MLRRPPSAPKSTTPRGTIPGVPAGARENIDYPASIRPIGVVTGNESISVGTDELDSRAKSYRARCPGTHINAQGYSDHGYAQPIPTNPGDCVNYQQPRIECARPTAPQAPWAAPELLDMAFRVTASAAEAINE